ncbi:alpha-tubulin N-acetyltransferase 1 isoform X2 [Antennarius striatus]|uniref:alpha-tubulin N-acetyltransferase 1 isoform X2 n=1 Tax=Antennarius striatus TaxID=241820 RepID=UPI0035B1733D
MEFPFDINRLFSERVTVLDEGIIAGRKSAGRPDLQAQISSVIDELGKASAMAQQLPAPITSASKLQSQQHQLYLLKEGERNGGRGAIVGFLKVGHKKLFLLDLQGVHIEAEPLCVLDFYISENLQRHGYGLELFDFMLQHKSLEPVLMAYDRPSPKFLSFLAKHYLLTKSVPQVNNFVVFEGFFLNRSAAQLRKVAVKKPEGEIKPYSLLEREAVRQELGSRPWPFAPADSPRRSVSHLLNVGSSPSRGAPAPRTDRDQSPQSPLRDRCRTRCSSRQGLVARGILYSRHMDSLAVGRLDTHLPGLRASADQSDSHRSARTRTHPNRYLPHCMGSQPPPLPLCAFNKRFLSGQTSVDRTDTPLDGDDGTIGDEQKIQALNGPQTGSASVHHSPSDRRRGWSYTPGENAYTAQWVKQKQGYYSTWLW